MMLALLLLAAGDPAPAVEPPKAGPVEHLRKQVVAAIRNCPEEREGEVVVCRRDRGIAEGYRLPRLDPRFAARVPAPAPPGGLMKPGPGEGGYGTCSAGGAAALGGCQAKLDDEWGAWKRDRQAQGDGFPW